MARVISELSLLNDVHDVFLIMADTRFAYSCPVSRAGGSRSSTWRPAGHKCSPEESCGGFATSFGQVNQCAACGKEIRAASSPSPVILHGVISGTTCLGLLTLDPLEATTSWNERVIGGAVLVGLLATAVYVWFRLVPLVSAKARSGGMGGVRTVAIMAIISLGPVLAAYAWSTHLRQAVLGPGGTAARKATLRNPASRYSITRIGSVWGVIIDRASAEETQSLIALADGQSSHFSSSGSAVLGSSKPGPERKAVIRKLCEAAMATVNHLEPATDVPFLDFPFPKRGNVRFYVLTTGGPRTAEVEESTLTQGGHALSTLFTLGQEVVAGTSGVVFVDTKDLFRR